MGGPRTDLIYPRVVEQRLRERGWGVECRVNSVPGEMTSQMRRAWPRQVLGFSPDVIVLSPGYYEAIHLLIPHWLERHKHTQTAGSGRFERLYRRFVLRTGYRAFANFQARVDRRFAVSFSRRQRKQVLADVASIVAGVRQVQSPLVFLMENMPVGDRYQSWFPGMNERIALTNEGLRAIAEADASGDVRYFETARVLTPLGGPSVVTPDGFHYSPEAHRALGDALAEDIAAWVADASRRVPTSAMVPDQPATSPARRLSRYQSTV